MGFNAVADHKGMSSFV